MKRMQFFATALLGLACSSSGKSGAVDAGGTSGKPSETSGTSASSASSGGGSGGEVVTHPGSGAGGSAGAVGASSVAGAGTIGNTRSGAGGTTTSRTGGGGVSTPGSGGTSRIMGGSSAVGGSAGVAIVATGPTAKDPVAAAADLTKYYVSNKGDDANTGTSPEAPWATLGKIPKNKAIAVFFDKGSKWAITVGGTSRSGLSLSAGSVYATYGTGEKPLILLDSSDQKTTAMAGVQLGGNNLVDGLKIKGYAMIGFPVGSNGNIVQNCEVDGAIDGKEAGTMQLGFSISGQHNLIVGNTVHDLSGVSGDTGNVNTSGGAEAFVMNAGNNEVAYNKAINCWVPNKTLNGAEGGCLEIIGNKAGQIIENAFFHHNYCERSVGLFEACAGNFSGDGQNIMLNHAKVRNSTVSYNVAVDAMWLYLLQPTNTDFEGLYFEHNTIIHGPDNTKIPQGGAAMFGLAYDTDPAWTTDKPPANIPCTTDTDCVGEKQTCLDKQGAGKICQYQFKLQPGTVAVRNNLFVVLPGADAGMMLLPPGPSDVMSNMFVPKAPMGAKAGTGIIVVADAGLVDTFKLAPTSPAINKGDPGAFQAWVDFEGRRIPCGSAPDIGAFEYCP
jgi:hypothetical protein